MSNHVRKGGGEGLIFLFSPSLVYKHQQGQTGILVLAQLTVACCSITLGVDEFVRFSRLISYIKFTQAFAKNHKGDINIKFKY